MSDDAAIVTKLDELLAAIRGYDDPRRAAAEWKQALKLLQKTDSSPVMVTNIVAGRDVFRLAALIDQLRAPTAATAPADVPDSVTCGNALRAFRKRLALTRLDDESRISSHSPLSKGEQGSSISAISPPVEWPEAVWQELVRQGRLRSIGHGLYELPKQP
jgi:hypothetical protein